MFFEELILILVGPEPIVMRAEKALTYLLDFDLDGDPNGEAWKVWSGLLSDINSSLLGGEELDSRWAQEVIQKIQRLLLLTHEVRSRGQWIEITNTKISKATVIQSGALPQKPSAGKGFRDSRKNVVNNVVKPSVFLQFMVGLPFISVWSSYGGISF